MFGNCESYDLRLHTDALTRPWQSFRATFTVSPQWTRLQFPFDRFEAHRTDARFAPAELRRIGIVAILHRAFDVVRKT